MVKSKLGYFGLSEQLFLSMDYQQAKAFVKQRILDIERQHDLNGARRHLISRTNLNRVVPMPFIKNLKNSDY